MKRVRALKETYYMSKTRHAGNEFEIHDSDLQIMVGIGSVEEVKGEEVQQKAAQKELENRALQAYGSATESGEPAKADPEVMSTDSAKPVTARKGRYPRRDLRAVE